MACELISAKLLAPYFGTSLYVWAAVLGLTLGGLTTGYFLGGRISKSGRFKPLFIVVSLASAFLILMPFSSQIIMEATISFSLESGALLSLFVFMVPPLVFMGMTSPLIINLLTDQANQAGNNAGTVYAISTLGGILYTFLLGFYVIPQFGLSMPAVISGIILFLLPLYGLIRLKSIKFIGLLILGTSMSCLALKSDIEYTENYHILYQSEGIFGQVKVVDHPSILITPDERIGRGLIVNNTLQTYVGVADDFQYSIWSWANYFPSAASIYPPGSKVLLLGLGGGTLVKQLNRLGFEVDVVEIDERIVDVSFEFFHLDRSTNIVIDDARHFINIAESKYDIIIYDTFLSESVPEHLLTKEGFADAKEILNSGGMIMANFYGFIEGAEGLAARSVYKTFIESGFTTEILSTPGAESNRNLIFLASENELDFTRAEYSAPHSDVIEDLYSHMINTSILDLSDAVVLSDSKPRLSKLYNKAAKKWRMSYNDYYSAHFTKKK
jgi:spermidine synthase